MYELDGLISKLAIPNIVFLWITYGTDDFCFFCFLYGFFMSKTTHKFYSENSTNLSFIPDKSIQLIVTSPPYPMIEMWDAVFNSQNPEISKLLEENKPMDAFRKMHEILNDVWRECDRVLADNCFVCINIGDATRTVNGVFCLFSNHSEIIRFFSDLGYSVLPDIIWHKATNSPTKFMGSGMYPAGAYVTYEHEYILIFRKGGKRHFTDDTQKIRKKSAYFWEERNPWFSDIWDIRGAAQSLKSSKTRTRNASFPFEIPYRLVNMYSIEGDVVLDPFGGLGTTSLACIAAGRNSISVDVDPDMTAMAIENAKEAKGQLNDVIDNRLLRHVSFIEALPEDKKPKYMNLNHGFPVKTKQETEIKIDKIKDICCEGNVVSSGYESITHG